MPIAAKISIIPDILIGKNTGLIKHPICPNLSNAANIVGSLGRSGGVLVGSFKEKIILGTSTRTGIIIDNGWNK
jgi:hypothetical protein